MMWIKFSIVTMNLDKIIGFEPAINKEGKPAIIANTDGNKQIAEFYEFEEERDARLAQLDQFLLNCHRMTPLIKYAKKKRKSKND